MVEYFIFFPALLMFIFVDYNKLTSFRLLKSGAAPDKDEAQHEFTRYTLPQLPMDINLHLRNVKAGDVPDNLRKKIIEWLSFNLSSQTM